MLASTNAIISVLKVIAGRAKHIQSRFSVVSFIDLCIVVSSENFIRRGRLSVFPSTKLDRSEWSFVLLTKCVVIILFGIILVRLSF